MNDRFYKHVQDIVIYKCGVFIKNFEGKETAFAYKLGEVQSFNPPRNLTDYNIKTAPQSFVYL